jgi:ferredoxin
MKYIIGGYCISCGECDARCPEGAILAPDDTCAIYHIDPDKCVGCGVCFDNCPLGIIVQAD